MTAAELPFFPCIYTKNKKLGFPESSILFQALQKCEEFLWSVSASLTTESFKEWNIFLWLNKELLNAKTIQKSCPAGASHSDVKSKEYLWYNNSLHLGHKSVLSKHELQDLPHKM